MIKFTYVARVTDGMMLVASIDTSSSSSDEQLKLDGKQLIRTLNVRSPRQCTLESGNYSFHYLMENNIVYLVLAEKSYPKRLAFLFLQELEQAFIHHVEAEHGSMAWEQQLATVDRPYAYIKFDKQIQRLRKEYSDPNSRQAMGKLNNDLNDVTNIMRRNIQDVIDRGERLNDVASASVNLVNDSKKFHFGAKKLNRLAFYRKWAPVAIGSFIVIFFLYLRLYVL